MKLTEIFNTKLDLNWMQQGDTYTASFTLDGREYEISVKAENYKGYSLARVDFHHIDVAGYLHHARMSHGAPALKVFGVVANSVRYQFSKFDCILFVAKRATVHDEEEYEIRKRLYSHLANKLAVEMNRFRYHESTPYEEIFALSKNKSVHANIKNMFTV